MNVCHNPNTPEFKSLLEIYKDPDFVQVLINLYNENINNASKIKEGVSELFESNSELANAVYEVLGFKSKPDVILPIGISGSGKSTFIKSLPQENLVIIEPDAMRVEFTGDMNDKSKDKQIYEEAAKRAITAIKQGKQVVFDTTNLTKDKRLPFIEAIKNAIPSANIQYKLMELNPELAKQRIKEQIKSGENRANVPDSSIDRQAQSYNQMIEDIKSEPISNFELNIQQKQQAQQLYSQYLDSIFPDSKVKDIVYHRSPNKFDKFDKNFKGLTSKLKDAIDGFFFSSRDIGEDIKYSMNIDLGSNVYNAILNIKNPIKTDTWSDTPNTKGNDGISRLYDDFTEYVAFEPEQIHILGNKQDIERFKQFVSNTNTTNELVIPTTLEVADMLLTRKKDFNNKKKNFSDKVMINLQKLGFITKVKNNWIIKKDINNLDANTNDAIIQNAILSYLDFLGFDSKLISFNAQGTVTKVNINPARISIEQMTPNADTKNTISIINHLATVFPQIKIKVISAEEAEVIYSKAADLAELNVDFNNVKSFYSNGTAYLINGRFNDNTAIEEIMHPFVDALYADNSDLFNGLLEDAIKSYPTIVQQVNSAYNAKSNFDLKTRSLEIVTKALANHINNKYELGAPIDTFTNKVEQFFKWFARILNKLLSAITAGKLVVSPSEIEKATSLSEIADMILTKNVTFNFDIVPGDLRLAIENKLRPAVEKIKGTANPLQQKIIDDLVLNDPQQLVLYKNVVTKDGNTKKHIYISEATGQAYTSVTTAIKGTMASEQEEKNAVTLLFGNQADAMLEGLAARLSFEEAFVEAKNMVKVLSFKRFQEGKGFVKGIPKEILEEIYNKLNELIHDPEFIDEGAVIIPQIIVGDYNSGIAGSIDLLVINTDGSLEVIDLKASTNSINKTKQLNNGDVVKTYSDIKYPQAPDSLLTEGTELSTKAQQGVQVSTYRRLLQNLNYTVINSRTIHIHLKTEGQGNTREVVGYEYEGSVNHTVTDNDVYVDQLVESNDSPGNKFNPNYVRSREFIDRDAMASLEESPETEDLQLLPALDKIVTKLSTRKQMLQRMFTDIKGFKNKTESINKLSQLLNSMETDINQTQYNEALGKLLRYTEEDINDFFKYLDNPNNFKSKSFPTVLLAYDKFLETYNDIGLAVDLGNTGNQAKGKKIREMLKEARERIDKSYIDFAESFVKENSTNPDLTEEDIKAMLVSTMDEGKVDSVMNSLGASTDTLLQLINKIYKRGLAKSQYDLEEFTNTAYNSGNKLVEESIKAGLKAEDAFLYMFAKNPDGKLNGRYVNRIGYQYWKIFYDLKEKTTDENGAPLKYKIIQDPVKQQADVQYNMDLYKAKKALSEFLRAEETDDTRPTDGEFHKYTDEFKMQRAKYETYTKWGWKRKPGVDPLAYSLYQDKYKNKITSVRQIIGPDGMFTGDTKSVTSYIVKRDFTEIKDVSSKGVDLRDAEYVKIMNPTDALGRARKEFYEFFIKEHQEESLSMLPPDVYYKMMGKIPRVKKNFLRKLRDMPTGRGKYVLESLKSFAIKKKKVYAKVAIENEAGELIQGPPIFYTADLQSQYRVDKLQEQVTQLRADRDSKKISVKEYLEKKENLDRILKVEESKLTPDQINTNLVESMILFRGMAENYKRMNEIEDTIMVIQKVIQDREYIPPGGVASKIKSAMGNDRAYTEKGNSNVEKRLRKWMEMTFRDDGAFEETVGEQYIKAVLNYTSLTYVGFNPFSALNNLIMGKINNAIETAGGQFYSKAAILRATKELNSDAMPGFMRQLGKKRPGALKSSAEEYELSKPESKYEAMVKFFRVIRGMQSSEGKVDMFSFAYLMSEGGEYAIQSKTAIAKLMSQQVVNEKSGESTSIYDAFDFDASNGNLVLKDGYKFTSTDRADVTNSIWRMNEMIHGNYAYEDRATIQNHFVGQLAMQFHKWVYPGLKIRFGKGRYDEASQVWMEGRYNTIFNFLKYFFTVKGNIIERFEESKGMLREEQLANMYKVLAEMGFFLASVAMYQMFEALKDATGDDDDDKELKRLLGALQFQGSKQKKEIITYVDPREYVRIMTNPIAASRSLGEFAEALGFTLDYFSPFVPEEDKYYKRTSRKGEPKYYKQWGDVAPILYEMNRWKSYDTVEDFYVKK